MTDAPEPVLVLGTAGHVDHGKTTLVRALTGMETDRLPEERRRGISIELGFAWRDLPDGRRVAIVDVPGHERFIRHMIGGAAGIDAVMLVIAADEGVMPQTREHLAICTLLGVRAGFVVLTRVDLVEPDFLELVVDDISNLLAGTFLAGAPILPFSALDPAPAVTPILSAIAALPPVARPSDRPFVLPIDRAFTVRGHGTIVTGTSLAGHIAMGDEVIVSPGGQRARVRGLEVHGRAVESVRPGRRVAVNLAQLAVDDVPRGARLVAAAALGERLMWDAELSLLGTVPTALGDGEKALLFVGTSQVEVTVALLDRATLDPGDSAPVQLRLAEPLAFLPAERFVLRGFRALGPLGDTLGGGPIHGPSPRRRSARHGLETWPWRLVGADLIAAVVAEYGEAGLDRAALVGSVALDRRALEVALANPALIVVGHRVLARRALAHLEAAILRELTAYHLNFPARIGLRSDELFTRVRPDGARDVFEAALSLASSRIVLEASELRLRSHRPAPVAPSMRQQTVESLLSAHLAPPSPEELAARFKVQPKVLDEEIRALVNEGVLVRVSKDLVFHEAPLTEFRTRVEQHFATRETLDAQGLKELTGVSRKFSIPLGEWLDRAKVTVRVGDIRRRRTVV